MPLYRGLLKTATLASVQMTKKPFVALTVFFHNFGRRAFPSKLFTFFPLKHNFFKNFLLILQRILNKFRNLIGEFMSSSPEERVLQTPGDAMTRKRKNIHDSGDRPHDSGDGARNNADNEIAGNDSGEGVVSGDILPQRLFATDRYPANGRINSYSKAEYLLDLVELLHGSLEYEWILRSCFKRLFQLPVRMSSVSGKLVHQILCRSLVTAKKHEMWFVFGGNPIRFSLREFGIITGLNCAPLPPPANRGESTNYSIIGPKSSYTIDEIMNMLKRDKRLPEGDEQKMDWQRRLRLALIVIVDGILVCDSSTVKASKNTADMVYDLDEFVKYPWGRLSFIKTIEMVKVGEKVANVGVLAEKLSQSHTATHGFTLAFQLLILKAVPMLQNHLPDVYDEQTFTDSSVVSLTKLKTFHNANILQTEMDPDVVVHSILQAQDPSDLEQDYSWDDEVADAAVDVLLNKVNEGILFKRAIWQGGIRNQPLITSCLPAQKKPKKPASRKAAQLKAKLKHPSKSKGKKNVDEGAESDFVGSTTAEQILVEVERKNNELLRKVRVMMDAERAVIRDKIYDDVIRTLMDKGVLKSSEVEGSEAEIRGNMENTSASSTQGLLNPNLREENINQELDDRAAVADILEKLKAVSEEAEVTEGNTNTEVSIPAQMSDPLSPIFEDLFVDDVVVPGLENSGVVQGNLDGQDVDGQDVQVCITATNADEGVKRGGQSGDGGQEQISGQEQFDGQKEHSEPSLKEIKAGGGRKRKDPVADQDLAPLPPKRTRSTTQRYGITYSLTRPAAGGDAKKKGPADGDARIKAPADGAAKKQTIADGEKCIAEGGASKKQSGDAYVPYVPGYRPFGIVQPNIREKFLAKLAVNNCEQEYIIDGRAVGKKFFEQLYAPTNRVDTPHMEAMLNIVWKSLSEKLLQSRIAVLDTLFSQTLISDYAKFAKIKNVSFTWNSIIKNYVRGDVSGRKGSLGWFTDVDTVYLPMHWGKGHWVAVVIKLREGEILILDPLIVKNDDRKLPQIMKPLVEMLPSFITVFLEGKTLGCPVPESYNIHRLQDVYQNERTGDCGPVAVKFIELHAQGLPLDTLTDSLVDEMRMKFAVNVYEEYVESLRE